VTIYGFPREPDAADGSGEPAPPEPTDAAVEEASPVPVDAAPNDSLVEWTPAEGADQETRWVPDDVGIPTGPDGPLASSPTAGRLRRAGPAVLAAAAAIAVALVLTAGTVGARLGHPDAATAWQGGQPTTAPPSAEVPAADADTVLLSGVGDVIMGSMPGDLPPRGGDGFFDRVKEALAADVVMGNLDQPITVDTGRVKCSYTTPPSTPTNPSPKAVKSSGCHQFYLPASYAKHLAAGGFDVVSLANNHTNDMGPAGLRNTRDALDAVGVKHTGAVGQITVVEAKGIKVAVLGFSVYSWGQNLNNIPAAVELVEKANAQADLVVIQMQGGAEGADKTRVPNGHEIFLGEDRGDLIKFTHAVIDAGADVVFGHGPHVMRGMEFYKGRLIAYSLGNFCGYGVLRGNGYLGVGGVLKVKLHKDGTWAGGTLVPTEMVDNGYPAPDSDKRALNFVDKLSRDNFSSTAARIAGDGTITPPGS